MKKLFITLVVLSVALVGKSQSQSGNSGTIAPKIVLENEKVKVTEFDSEPGGDACGKGQHRHNERLVIAITDATIKMTTEDGKTQNLELKAGTAFWGGTELHSVVNTGKQTARFYAVELKQSK